MNFRAYLSILLSLFMSEMYGQLLREQNFVQRSSGATSATRSMRFDNRMTTQWAELVDSISVLGEYPRPIMEREDWKSLNGYWDYAICDSGKVCPDSYDGMILVPFCAESYLSGVEKPVTKDNELWYHRTFTVPEGWAGKHIILNFGAVDWRADVWVNGHHLACHKGGFTSFSMDITDALCDSVQELVVRVWDPTDDGYQLRGKQSLEPHTIYYTAVTGIWQTVWIEPVMQEHISRVTTFPDYDNAQVRLLANTEGDMTDCSLRVRVLFDDEVVASASGNVADTLTIQMPEDFLSWTPDNPWLYDIQVELIKDGDALDVVKSYTAMRKFSCGKDKSGRKNLLLNGNPIFQFGPLDQGYFPDGLYTAPTDEAMLYDLQKIKNCGYNMVRKHLKVEPARWYTYCDRMGIIVWQDIPSGDSAIAVDNKLPSQVPYNLRSEESAQDYMSELDEIMTQLMPYPCISTWVLFNEGVGQFNTQEIAKWTKQRDPSRFVNAASGGNYHYTGDMLDSHHYPSPFICQSSRNYAIVIGEFGGLGLAMAGHVWNNSTGWAYMDYSTRSQFQKYYEIYTSYLYNLKYQGLCAAVYTQLTDVEIETNGLMTYDREIMKIDVDWLYTINQFIINLSRDYLHLAER